MAQSEEGKRALALVFNNVCAVPALAWGQCASFQNNRGLGETDGEPGDRLI